MGTILAVLALSCANQPKDDQKGPAPTDVNSDVPEVSPSEGGGGGDVAHASTEAPKEKAEPAAPAWKPQPQDKVAPEFDLEFKENLTHFFDALAEVDDGEKKIVTVVHLGASMIGMDDLPSIMREKFQTRFGDGGAGLVLMQRYMSNYIHRWVKLDASGWSHCYIAYLCKKDGHYGLGGTTFWARSGAKTTISTRRRELGDEVSRYELWYAAQKFGGKVELRVDRDEPVYVSTSAESLEDRYHELDVEQGPHTIRVRALGPGPVRTYGVLLETDGPGVVWDQFSMLGAFTKRMLGWDKKHIAGQIEHRDPELIVFMYGGNDSRRVALSGLTREKYAEEYTTAVKNVRAGKPDASCLIVGVTDRSKSLTHEITGDHMEVLVGAQRDTAEAAGCAWFDSYHHMGGSGSLRKWRRMDPPQAEPDMKHLNHRGREVLGGWIYDALVAGYVAHRTKKDSSSPAGPAGQGQ